MDDYKIIRSIGKGSFGKVYLVRHEGERKQYVMKVIKLKGIPAKERDACKNEVALMQRLAHPNIVAYKDSFFANGRDNLCIVMTYCDGGDLAARLLQSKSQLFKEDQIMHWFVQIALAIHYMHENNVLHRDIKTQNVFLLGNGRLVLGDLGISKVLDGTMAFASTQIGTPYYMSPELFKNKPYNHKSDVWALGCVLYEMCTLQHPFDATSLSQLAQKIAKGQYNPIHHKYSQSLRALISSILSVNSSTRPSMAEILQQPYIKKHICNFLKDTIERSSLGVGVMPGRDGPNAPISEGTMMFQAAAMKAAGDVTAGLGPHADNLHQQLVALGLQSIVTKAIADVEVAKPPQQQPSSARNNVINTSASAPSLVVGPKFSAPIVGARPLMTPIASSDDLLNQGKVSVAAQRDLSPGAAKRRVKEHQSALDREEERRLAVQNALERLKKEKELRMKQREEFKRKAERFQSRASQRAEPPIRRQAVAGMEPGLVSKPTDAKRDHGIAENLAPRARVPVGVGVRVNQMLGVAGQAAQMNVAAPAPSHANPYGPAAGKPGGKAAVSSRPAVEPATSAKAPKKPGDDAVSKKQAKPAEVPSKPLPLAAAARKADFDKKRVEELNQWEKDRVSRAHAKAIGVAQLHDASPKLAAAIDSMPPVAPSVAGAASNRAPSAPKMPTAALRGDTPKPADRPSPILQASSVPTQPAARSRLPSVESAVALPASVLPSMSQSPVLQSGVPDPAELPIPLALNRNISPVVLAPVALEHPAPALSGMSEPMSPSSLAAYLPDNYDTMTARERVLARKEAARRAEEGKQRQILAVAAQASAAERKRAAYFQREQYRGVNAAMAGLLPIHSTVLEESVADASDLVATLQLRLPGARYGGQQHLDPLKETKTSDDGIPEAIGMTGELPSESKHEDVNDSKLEEAAAEDAVPGDEGYRHGELPDTDSEDSDVLEAVLDDAAGSETDEKYYGSGSEGTARPGNGKASHSKPPLIIRVGGGASRVNTRTNFKAPHRPHLALDSGSGDDEDISTHEQQLKKELMRSTMRCNELRASVEVARKLAKSIGIAMSRAHNTTSRPDESVPAPLRVPLIGSRPPPSYADDEPLPATSVAQPLSQRQEDRPIRPSQSTHAFGPAAADALPVAATQSILKDAPTLKTEPQTIRAATISAVPASTLLVEAANPSLISQLQGGQPGIIQTFTAPASRYGVIEEEDDEYSDDDDDDLGDEDGNVEGAVQFHTNDTIPEEDDEEAYDDTTSLSETFTSVAREFKPTVVPEAPQLPHASAYTSLSSRVESLRRQCIVGLGPRLFEEVYVGIRQQMLEDDGGSALDLSSIQVKVGPEKTGYVDSIVSLLDMEQALL